MSYWLDRYKKADEVKKEGDSMNRAFIFGIALLVVVTVALLCGSIALYIIKENEVEKRVSLEKHLATVTGENERLTEEIEELRQARTEAELQLALKEKDLENLKEKFDLFKIDKTSSEEFEKEKVSLVKRLKTTQGNLDRLKKDFGRLQESKEMLEQKLKSAMSSGVKLETIIVEPEEPEDIIEGEVLAVNKEYEFLVVNLGVSSGISKNAEVSIYRDTDLVAVGQIERLYENISAVIVEDKKELKKVKVGDVAVVSIAQYE